MDRVARLVTASVGLRRQIWASLPFNERYAHFLSRLASSLTDAFGKTIFGEFIAQGVQGMPDVHGKPADGISTNRLPSGYGRDFGMKAYKTLISKYHNPTFVEDVMGNYVVKFLDSKSFTAQGLKEAETYVLRGLSNTAVDMLRKKKEMSDIKTRHDDEDDETEHLEVSDEPQQSAEQILGEVLPHLKTKLTAIHPDAMKYIQLSLVGGYTDREIVGDVKNGVQSMLSHPYNTKGSPLNSVNWNQLYKTKIYDVLKRELGPGGIQELV